MDLPCIFICTLRPSGLCKDKDFFIATVCIALTRLLPNFYTTAAVSGWTFGECGQYTSIARLISIIILPTSYPLSISLYPFSYNYFPPFPPVLFRFYYNQTNKHTHSNQKSEPGIPACYIVVPKININTFSF
jgi:hypothetical protein